MKVKAVMTPNPVVAARSTYLSEVARKMLDNDVGEIPIVHGDKPIGVVTDRDIVIRLVAHGQDPKQVRAEDCMTSPAITIDQDADLKDCAELMAREKVRRIPIVDAQGRLCGIVALADLERRTDTRSMKVEVFRHVSQPH